MYNIYSQLGGTTSFMNSRVQVEGTNKVKMSIELTSVWEEQKETEVCEGWKDGETPSIITKAPALESSSGQT